MQYKLRMRKLGHVGGLSVVNLKDVEVDEDNFDLLDVKQVVQANKVAKAQPEGDVKKVVEDQEVKTIEQDKEVNDYRQKQKNLAEFDRTSGINRLTNFIILSK